jgi:hypothetical protein
VIRTTTRILKICFYGLIILIGVTFAVSNRGKVDLTFYPMPYALTLPLFLFTIFVFSLGLGLGWLLARLKAGSSRRAHKEASKRVAALENELSTLRTEQMIRPAMALPQK